MFDRRSLERQLSAVRPQNGSAPQLNIIYNPAAGNGDKSREIDSLAKTVQADGCLVEISPTNYPHHATELARSAVAKGSDIVFAAGGDGTMNEVLQGLVGQKIVMGVIPNGTVNILARDLGLSSNPTEALRRQLSGRVVPFDVGRINDRYFATHAGVGFDSEGIASMHTPGQARKVKGFWSYTDVITRQFLGFVPYHARVMMNNETHDLGPTIVTIFNNTEGYGPISLRPDASYSDGQLDLSLLLEKNKKLVVSGLLNGWFKSLNPHLFSRSNPTFTLETDRPLALQVDGEPYGDGAIRRVDNIAVSTIRHGINVLVPA